MQHLVVLAVHQRQLELVLRGVDAEDTRPTLTVQAVDVVSLDTRHVDRQIQCSDDAVVTASTTAAVSFWLIVTIN